MNTKLPELYNELVVILPPQPIKDDAHHQQVMGMIDHLLRLPKLTAGQSVYLEMLVQLVQIYEDLKDIEGGLRDPDGDFNRAQLSGIEALQHLLLENKMLSSTSLADLLGISEKKAAAILTGKKPLNVNHLKKLAERFKVRPDLFI